MESKRLLKKVKRAIIGEHRIGSLTITLGEYSGQAIFDDRGGEGERENILRRIEKAFTKYTDLDIEFLEDRECLTLGEENIINFMFY